jgi:hypothetical protein
MTVTVVLHMCDDLDVVSLAPVPTLHHPLQSEVILRCGLSPYQSALYDIVKAALRAERDKAKGADKGAAAASRGVKGVNNTVMELRNICNHPMLRWVATNWSRRLPEQSVLSLLAGSGRVGCAAMSQGVCPS